jgi:hypothetical protein
MAANFYKEYFDIWEKHTARYLDTVLRSPLFLEALDLNLKTSLAWQQTGQKALEAVQHSWGVPTRSDQERLQHQVNQLTTQVRQLAQRVDALEQDKD